MINHGQTFHSPLNNKKKASLGNDLSDATIMIINKFSIVLSDLFLKINTQLLKIFMCSIVIVDDLLQWPSVMGNLFYATVNEYD